MTVLFITQIVKKRDWRFHGTLLQHYPKVHCKKPLTTPIRSPLPYSPTSSFLPFALRMTERRRPLRTIYVQSDWSSCLYVYRHKTRTVRDICSSYGLLCHRINHDGHACKPVKRWTSVPVESSTCFHSHPVNSKVHLSDKWWHPDGHSVRCTQHHAGLLPHNPEQCNHIVKRKMKALNYCSVHVLNNAFEDYMWIVTVITAR